MLPFESEGYGSGLKLRLNFFELLFFLLSLLVQVDKFKFQ